jgi:hypothetical protein
VLKQQYWASRLCSLSTKTIERFVASGSLPLVKFSERCVRIRRVDLIELINQKEREKFGLVPAQAERDAALLPLGEHLAAFIAEKAQSSSCPRYVRELELRLARLFRGAVKGVAKA